MSINAVENSVVSDPGTSRCSLVIYLILFQLFNLMFIFFIIILSFNVYLSWLYLLALNS